MAERTGLEPVADQGLVRVLAGLGYGWVKSEGSSMLSFDTAVFSYVAVNDSGQAIVAFYGRPTTRVQAGYLSRLLYLVKAEMPDKGIRSVVWLPAFVGFYPGAFWFH